MKPHPLELPEIRDQLPKCLTQRRDLVASAKVSREWYQTFATSVWRDLKIVYEKVDGVKDLCKDNLINHSDFIHKLTWDGHPELDYLHCRHLQTLVLEWFEINHQVDFIARHRHTLRDLSCNIESRFYRPCNHHFWKTLASCCQLKSLTLFSAHVMSQDWADCWHLWSRLLCLRLRYFRFIPTGEALSTTTATSSFFDNFNPPATTIKELELSFPSQLGSYHDQLALLKWCPKLETLSLDPDDLLRHNLVGTTQPQDGHHLGPCLADYAHCCPKLAHLTIGSHPSEANDEILYFLESRTRYTNNNHPPLPLESLILAKNWFGELSWRWIRDRLPQYLTTIRCVELGDSLMVHGHMVQEMLCSMPQLESFTGPYLREDDILNDPRPWVCLGLVKLTVSFERAQGSTSTSGTIILGRLAMLTQLKFLDMSALRDDKSPQLPAVPYLRLEVGHGLEILKSLSQLECLNIRDMGQEWTEPDVYWMRENWSRRRLVVGVLHPDAAYHHSLVQLLQESGVVKWSLKGEREDMAREVDKGVYIV